MSQFAVYKNPNADTAKDYPLLLDIQNDLLGELGTRVVVPLCRPTETGDFAIKTLTPTFEIDGETYVMLTPELAGIATRQLGAKAGSLQAYRDQIIAALDLLITGI